MGDLQVLWLTIVVVTGFWRCSTLLVEILEAIRKGRKP